MKYLFLIPLLLIKLAYTQVAPVSYSKFLCSDQIYKNQMFCLNERLSEEVSPLNPISNCYYSDILPPYDYINLVNQNTNSFYNLELVCINSPNKVAITKLDDFCWSVTYLDSGVFLFNINTSNRFGRIITYTDTTFDYSCGQNRTWKQLTTIINNSIPCNDYDDTICNLIQNGSFEEYTTCPPSFSYSDNINYSINWHRVTTTGIPTPYHLCGDYIGRNSITPTGIGTGNIPPQPFPSGGGYLRLNNYNANIAQSINLCANQKYRFSTYSMRGSVASQDINLSGVNTPSFPTNNALTNLATISANDINLYYNWHKFTKDFTTPASFNGIIIEGMGYYDDISITPIDTVIFNTQLIANRCDSAEMILTIPGCYGPYNLEVVVNTDTLNFLQIQDGYTLKIPLAKNNIVQVLSITNSLGCATVLNTSDTLTVNNSGDASFTSSDFCEGQTNTITFLADTGTFALVNDTTSATINTTTGIISGVNDNQTFIISHAVCLDTVYDTIQSFKNSALFTSSNICVGYTNSINISGTTGGIFSLTPPTYGATIDVNTGIVTGSSIGNSYTIKYKVGNPCTDSSTQTVQVVAIEDPSFTTSDFCINTNNTIAITGSQNGTFSFYPIPNDGATINSSTGIINGATAGNAYTIKYVTAGICKDSSTQAVNALAIPTSNLISNGGDLCGKDSVPITLNLTGTSPWNISYTDGITTYTVNNILNSPYTLFAKTLGNYQILSVSDNQCSNTKDTSVVTVNGDSVIVFSDIKTGCEPQEVKFWSNVNGLNGDCVWNFGDGSNDLNLCDTVSHTYYSSGQFGVSLQVSSPKCKDTVIVPNYISIKPNPTAVFYFTPQNPSVLNNTVQFTNSSINNIENFWYLNNNIADTIEEPSIKLPAIIGDHEVCLIVKNIFNCFDTICNDIYVLDESLFYIPNAFVPNNDGLNDIFKPIISNTTIYNFKIFNRWGKLIFETNETTEGWDGTYQGEKINSGIYTYKITYRFKGNFDDQYLNGHFTMLK